MSAGTRPLRVLLLVDHARMVGGAERFIVGLAAHLPRDRIEPWVCSSRQADPDAIEALAAAGVPHFDLGRTATWQAHRFEKLARLIRRQRFDVLHANLFGSNFWGTLIGRACRVPVVLSHEHTWSFENNRVRMWIDGRVIGRLATRCLTVSAADKERMIKLEGVPEDKLIVVPYPHVPHAPSQNGGIRGELGLDSTTPLVGVAAVFREQKALDVMIDAHARLLADVPDAHLVIAGDGFPPARENLERQIDRLGVSSSVHLLGMRNDVDAILRAVDVAALSSDYEGKPLFVLECMAAGTPLVATAVGGLPEMIQDGDSGLLVPPRDPDALATGLRKVLTDRALGSRLAATASSRNQEFTIDRVTGTYVDLYERLVAEAR